ncbi:MAG: hypothetical protein A2563_00100 [Candidatus Magasanikbacteria bacterium RIFOXYD1_FULL_40_23]|uniref:Pilus assembly protein PilO n=1 Tax=Candidatus Magasanikbacteria bacterium RIFOXYD1_FULL_40_23 TaxID=1798705 RepID=A0A1F6P856_9BACT|nr:MAG: hypothetical protein A2563_00100 [Candidatus Magasanikbacteria bacterium RIFOXYD1_FULL_40_23]
MLLFFGTIFGILTPTLIRIRKTARESLKLRLFLEQKYQESLNSRITRKKLSEIKSAAANFENFIFKSGDELRLITFLESSAAKFSVTPSITSSNLDKISNNRLVTISMNLKGDYNNILKYISELESSNYFIHIKQLHLTPAFTKDGKATLTVNLTITTELYVNE